MVGMDRTLREMRSLSQKSIGQVLIEVRRICPEVAPKERSGIINWEVQGFRDFRIVHALSQIYAVPEAEIGRAALKAKEEWRQKQEEKSSGIVAMS
jgi:hypothetical protein